MTKHRISHRKSVLSEDMFSNMFKIESFSEITGTETPPGIYSGWEILFLEHGGPMGGLEKIIYALFGHFLVIYMENVF